MGILPMPHGRDARATGGNMPAIGQATGKKLWKAGELARETGLTRQALHQYVLAGLLVPADLTKGGQRLFEKDAVKLVQVIREATAIGYPLREVRDIFLKKCRERRQNEERRRMKDEGEEL